MSQYTGAVKLAATRAIKTYDTTADLLREQRLHFLNQAFYVIETNRVYVLNTSTVTGDLLDYTTHLSSEFFGIEEVSTFTTNRAYTTFDTVRDADTGTLYRVMSNIAANNTSNFTTLLNDGTIQKLYNESQASADMIDSSLYESTSDFLSNSTTVRSKGDGSYIVATTVDGINEIYQVNVASNVATIDSTKTYINGGYVIVENKMYVGLTEWSPAGGGVSSYMINTKYSPGDLVSDGDARLGRITTLLTDSNTLGFDDAVGNVVTLLGTANPNFHKEYTATANLFAANTIPNAIYKLSLTSSTTGDVYQNYLRRRPETTYGDMRDFELATTQLSVQDETMRDLFTNAVSSHATTCVIDGTKLQQFTASANKWQNVAVITEWDANRSYNYGDFVTNRGQQYRYIYTTSETTGEPYLDNTETYWQFQPPGRRVGVIHTIRQVATDSPVTALTSLTFGAEFAGKKIFVGMRWGASLDRSGIVEIVVNSTETSPGVYEANGTLSFGFLRPQAISGVYFNLEDGKNYLIEMTSPTASGNTSYTGYIRADDTALYTFIAGTDAVPTVDGSYIFVTDRPSDTPSGIDSATIKGSLLERVGGVWYTYKLYDDAPATISDTENQSYSKFRGGEWLNITDGRYIETYTTLADLFAANTVANAIYDVALTSATTSNVYRNSLRRLPGTSYGDMRDFELLLPQISAENNTMRDLFMDAIGTTSTICANGNRVQRYSANTDTWEDLNVLKYANIPDMIANANGNISTGGIAYVEQARTLYVHDGSKFNAIGTRYAVVLGNYDDLATWPAADYPDEFAYDVVSRVTYKSNAVEWQVYDDKIQRYFANTSYSYGDVIQDGNRRLMTVRSPIANDNTKSVAEQIDDGVLEYVGANAPPQHTICTTLDADATTGLYGGNAYYKAVVRLDLTGTDGRIYRNFVTYDKESVGTPTANNFSLIGSVLHAEDWTMRDALTPMVASGTKTRIYGIQYVYDGTTGQWDKDISGYVIRYSSVTQMLADQAKHILGHWYFVNKTGYLYNGNETASLNDYTSLGGIEYTDRDKLVQYKNAIFLPQDVTKVYEDIRDAIADGVWVAGTSATTPQLWYEGYIQRADYYDIKVPAGTAVVALRSIQDVRFGNYSVRYTDGNQEIIGGFGHGSTQADLSPSLFGHNSSWSSSYYHRWFLIPVSKTNKQRTIRITRDTSDDSYLSGLAFASENIWQFSETSAIALTRNKVGPLYADSVLSRLGAASNAAPWNSGNNSGSALLQYSANTTYRHWITCVGGGDQILYFGVYRDNQDNWDAAANFRIWVNGHAIGSDLTGSFVQGGSGLNDHFPRPHPGWSNPAQQSYSNGNDEAIFFAVRVPAEFLEIPVDSDGYEVPQVQHVTLQTGLSSDLNYIRTIGFMKYDLGETYLQLVYNEIANNINDASDDWTTGTRGTAAIAGSDATIWYNGEAVPSRVYLTTSDGSDGTGTSRVGYWRKDGGADPTTQRSVTLPNGSTGNALWNGGNIDACITVDLEDISLDGGPPIVIDFWAKFSALETWSDLFGMTSNGVSTTSSTGPTTKAALLTAAMIRNNSSDTNTEIYDDGAYAGTASFSSNIQNWNKYRIVFDNATDYVIIYQNNQTFYSRNTIASNMKTFWVGGLSPGETVRGCGVDVYGITVWRDENYTTVPSIAYDTFIPATARSYTTTAGGTLGNLYDVTELSNNLAAKKVKVEKWTKVGTDGQNGINTAVGIAGTNGKLASGDNAWIQTSGYTGITQLP